MGPWTRRLCLCDDGVGHIGGEIVKRIVPPSVGDRKSLTRIQDSIQITGIKNSIAVGIFTEIKYSVPVEVLRRIP